MKNKMENETEMGNKRRRARMETPTKNSVGNRMESRVKKKKNKMEIRMMVETIWRT